jgi:CHAD domain-containing protein
VSYRFDHPERLAFEIRRVATERLENALEQLGDELARNPAVAVHTARKDIKKTRSLLRLVKDSLGADRFKAENGRLRDAAHVLASAREADAKAEALASLIGRTEGSASPETLAAARAWHDGMTSGSGHGADVVHAASGASALIRQARDDARLWALGYGSFELIAPGIRRTYRQGRRGLAAAADDPSDETVHEWRKRVKDMWYSLRLLGDVWEPVIRPMADQAHDLSEHLGNHHDLGEVRSAVEGGEAGMPEASGAELVALVDARQAELHVAAISLGGRLYAERPGRYVERLEGLWHAWETGASQQMEQAGLPGS